jgi:hypothetical protein
MGRRHIKVQHELGVGLQAHNYPKAEGLKTFTSYPTS